MQIIKIGGKSLANGQGIQRTIEILKSEIDKNKVSAIVLSARGNTTNQLEKLLDSAACGFDIQDAWHSFKTEQTQPYSQIDFSQEFDCLDRLFRGVALVGEYSDKTKDLVLAQGEIMSTKLVSTLLQSAGYQTKALDSRDFFCTDSNFGNAAIQFEKSKQKTQSIFQELSPDIIPIVTGFIAADEENNTTTLGRNGSNYTASLLANILDATLIKSYTHIDGIYSANPDYVADAQIIPELSYTEASELASFGASILHPKTIEPLVDQEIALHILNTFNPSSTGTRIQKQSNQRGVKAVVVQQDAALISISGKGLLGKIGIDARIFSALSAKDISVSIISQGSSERSVSFVIAAHQAQSARLALEKEFKHEFSVQDIHDLCLNKDISIVTVVGANINGFADTLKLFRKNKIKPLLLNQTIHKNNIAIILNKADEQKTVNLIHSQIFGADKTINVAIFGVGTVGSSLIQQIIEAKDNIQAKKQLKINVFAICNSKQVYFPEGKLHTDYQEQLLATDYTSTGVQELIAYADANNYTNLIAIDNTASSAFVEYYPKLVESGFDLISSNKIANTQAYSEYESLRKLLKQYNKTYLYETNVGAGLPIIDTIRLLHESGENITKIQGVFSGSLSYIFNTYSAENRAFSSILKDAIAAGYTEPDPREDLCGNDVARKLLILARELDLQNEMEEIDIQNLIPEQLRSLAVDEFLEQLTAFDEEYDRLKSSLKADEVLRYVGILDGDLQQDKAQLQVKLIAVPKNTAMGNLQGSDSLIEIYTDSYGDKPITIIGAGAGASVTARGVFGDMLRIAEKK